jgi:hypothetical protein
MSRGNSGDYGPELISTKTILRFYGVLYNKEEVQGSKMKGIILLFITPASTEKYAKKLSINGIRL